MGYEPSPSVSEALRTLPREKLVTEGPQALSDRELLAVILGSGVRGRNVRMLAADVVEKLDTLRGVPSPRTLAELGGLGPAKAGAITAMLEFGRRRWGPYGSRITSPGDAYPLIRHFADRQQERFLCLSLNGAHELIATRVVTVGLVNRAIVHPREVFADPLADRASAIIVAHNHPSGRLDPSDEDLELTRRLKLSGELLGIPILDHLIFCENGWLSFVERGLLTLRQAE